MMEAKSTRSLCRVENNLLWNVVLVKLVLIRVALLRPADCLHQSFDVLWSLQPVPLARSLRKMRCCDCSADSLLAGFRHSRDRQKHAGSIGSSSERIPTANLRFEKTRVACSRSGRRAHYSWRH